MKTIVKTFQVYDFAELTDESKERAIEKLADINVNYEWWDSVYEDAKTIELEITSFDDYQATAEFIKNPHDTAKAIIKNHGKDYETYQTAQTFLTGWEELEAQKNDDNEYEIETQQEEVEEEFLNSLCEDYRIMLSKEYDYLISKETIVETIKANEYEFMENGDLY